MDEGSVSAGELAELIGAFTEVTARLEATQNGLRSEVSRLRGELGEANEQLARSRRLAALGEMAAGIAHEIRNPLASITLYARMLREDLSDRPEQAEVARKIEAGVRGLNGIVSDVLAFARESRIEPAATDVSWLLDVAIEAASGGSAVAIERAYQTRELGSVEVDAGLMRQALVNVIRNAIEALAESAVVEPRIRIDGEASAGGVCISVEDNGPGIPPEVADRVFNPFFTTRRSGTGLGLAIVHRIVDAHGGGLWVGRSVLGGACVRVSMGRRLRESAQEPPEISTRAVVASDVAGRFRGHIQAKERA